ncbi:MAG: NADH-quinone oxidoreductase subunit N [Microthrixaceae bacterium]
MLASLIGRSAEFVSPTIDWHAIAPEVVLAAVALLIVVLDSVMLERAKPLIPGLAGLGFLAALIPVLTLATSSVEVRGTFDGAFIINDRALALKALFLVTGYIVVLLSTKYMAEGDYWESEYYALMMCSVLGMTVMASAMDLITIFIALELLSIPAYMLAGWRKRDTRSNEAGLKYYLMGVFATGIFLYGFSLLYGVSGSTNLGEIATAIGEGDAPTSIVVVALVLSLVGFGFKVSAVPFHAWAPDTYEGAPTPVTAFLAVASKTAGFAALIQLVFIGFAQRGDVVQPVMFILAALSMTVGNLIALRQTNVVRMLAYSGIAQAGFILAPFAVYVADPELAVSSVVSYLLIYAAMNLGAFACVIAIARKTGSAERDSFGGLFSYAPGLTVLFTLFLASLVGIPPLGGWYAKFSVMNALVGAGTGMGYALAVILAVNTAIGAFYYMAVARSMWFDEVPDGDVTPIKVPVNLIAAIAICIVATLVAGILPDLITQLSTVPTVAAGLGG